MLKLLIIFSLLQPPAYKVEGVIKGAEGKHIKLIDRAFYNNTHPTYSVTADKSGHFIFEGTINEPTYYAIRVEDINAQIEFILQNTKINISGNADSLWTAVVSGSSETDIQNKFVSFTGYDTNQSLYNAYEAEHDSAIRRGDTSARSLWEFRRDSLIKGMRMAAGRFINKYPNSITAINAITYYMEDLEQADSLVSVFERLPVKSNKQVVYFRNLIDKKKSLQIGSTAPDFTLLSTQDKPVTLSSLRGQYVLLDFWASWCSPCRQENPNLVRIHRNNKSKGFTIVSVALDESREAWINAIQKDNVGNWTHLSDLKGWNNKVAIQYGIDQIPTSLLIDKNGKIIAKNLRGDALEQKINSLLSQSRRSRE